MLIAWRLRLLSHFVAWSIGDRLLATAQWRSRYWLFLCFSDSCIIYYPDQNLFFEINFSWTCFLGEQSIKNGWSGRHFGRPNKFPVPKISNLAICEMDIITIDLCYVTNLINSLCYSVWACEITFYVFITINWLYSVRGVFLLLLDIYSSLICFIFPLVDEWCILSCELLLLSRKA